MKKSRFSAKDMVFKQLQENQLLKLQIFRLQNILKQLSAYAYNGLLNKQMLLQKIITELSYSIRKSGQRRFPKEDNQALKMLIEQSLSDLSNMLGSISELKDQINQTLQNKYQAFEDTKQIDSIKEVLETSNHKKEQLINDYKVQNERLEKQLKIIGEELYFTNMQKDKKIDLLEIQLKQINEQYALNTKQLKKMSIQKNIFFKKMSNEESSNKPLVDEIKKLRQANDKLSQQLKQSKTVSSQYIAYFQKKSKKVQQENTELIETHRSYLAKQKQYMQMIKNNKNIIAYQQKQIIKNQEKITEYKEKFNRIIFQDQKIKKLEQNKNFNEQKGSEKQKLIKDVSKSILIIDQKQNQSYQMDQNDKNGKKKFKLAVFQEKVMNNIASKASLYYR